jgi:AraC-like DNA-binding protein
MAAILGRAADAGLERSCRERDWVRARGPVNGVELLQAWFSSGGFEKHRHDTYGIGVTEAGIQAFDYRGQVERSMPGQVMVLHPDEAHDGRSAAEGGFGYRIVYVNPEHIAQAVHAITGRPATLPFVREPVSRNSTLAGAVGEAFQSALEPLAIDALIVRLAQGLLELDSTGHASASHVRIDAAALARGRDLLERSRAAVPSAQLEAVTGLSRFELARQFRLRYGTSPHRYSVLRRLDFAREQLRAGAPLVDLALGAGFADQAHFTRAFKSAYGVTPRRYARLSISTAG